MAQVGSAVQNKQIEYKVINGAKFKLISFDDPDDEEGPGRLIEIYLGDKKVFKHTLLKSIGDCSSENLELGQYDIQGSNIVFYSYWASGDRQGINLFPFGFRKQVYSIGKNGSVKLTDAKLYIESETEGYPDTNIYQPKDLEEYHQPREYYKKLRFLLTNKLTAPSEIKLLKKYISSIEEDYSGKFVLGKEKDLLEQEVRKKMHDAISLHTENWKEVFVYFNR